MIIIFFAYVSENNSAYVCKCVCFIFARSLPKETSKRLWKVLKWRVCKGVWEIKIKRLGKRNFEIHTDHGRCWILHMNEHFQLFWSGILFTFLSDFIVCEFEKKSRAHAHAHSRRLIGCLSIQNVHFNYFFKWMYPYISINIIEIKRRIVLAPFDVSTMRWYFCQWIYFIINVRIWCMCVCVLLNNRRVPCRLLKIKNVSPLLFLFSFSFYAFFVATFRSLSLSFALIHIETID